MKTQIFLRLMHFLRECWSITCSVNPVHYWFVFERLLLNTYSVCIIMLTDEYWQNHPELHDVPIYYASQLAKKCMSGTVRTWLYIVQKYMCWILQVLIILICQQKLMFWSSAEYIYELPLYIRSTCCVFFVLIKLLLLILQCSRHM